MSLSQPGSSGSSSRPLFATELYVTGMIAPLLAEGLRRIEGEVQGTTLRITVFVSTAHAKSVVIGRGGENIHAIQHLANERQHRDDARLKVKIDVILNGGGDA